MTDSSLNVLTICGSLRKGSYNRMLMHALRELAPPRLVLSEAPPFGGLPLYNFDVQEASGFPADAVAWADAIRAADALIIVSPEYNWTIPAPLKNAIDWVSRMKEQPFKGKPVAIQSAATGLLGGARMQQHLRACLTGVDAVVFGRPEVLVTFAAQKFDDSGRLKDEPTREMIKQHLAGFAAFAARIVGK
ncbi:MAG TPA: NADPH-dependent FMN reductase [Xanthobacteraceae bacterium]|nr:NADPH-dependent FMN reductase [Xanthobacteraceae bacterium]